LYDVYYIGYMTSFLPQKRPPDPKKWEENPRFLRKILNLHKDVLGETKK